jgi:polypeptide N-acetylgalactosaminyltransferase
MPDMVERFPYDDPGAFARGAIQSEANLSLCVDLLEKPRRNPLGLLECHENLIEPEYSQNFTLTWHRQIKLNNELDLCCEYKIAMKKIFYFHLNFSGP